MPEQFIRGYSLLDQFKTVDDEQRIIEGIATTPEVDRDGDIVMSDGATYQLPMPLLWQHRADEPIGSITHVTVLKTGIKIRAQIAKDTGLAEIERAWKLIKAGLVRGLSIRARSLEQEPVNAQQPWGGTRYKRWLWLETSAVTIAANGSATISAIKSIDTAQRAQSGASARPSPSASADASGASRPKESRMATPISEQVTSAQAELQKKNARLAELDDLDGADGGLEDVQVTERDTLTKDVEVLSGKVQRLKAREKAELALARDVVVKAPNLDVRDVPRPRVIMGDGPSDKLPKGVEFARAVICRAAGAKMGVSALELAKHYYPDFPRIQQFLKEAVPAGSTLDSTWAGPLVYPQNLINEFVEFLRDMTIIGKIDGFTRVPFNSRFNGQTSGGAGYWVGQGKAKPLTKFDYNEITVPFTKVANISVLTEELIRFSNPNAEINVRNQLARACQERLDIDFIDPAKTSSAGISPASITNGITHIDSSGVTLDAVDVDVQAIMTAFINAKIMPTHWIMPQTVALSLSLMRTALGNYAYPTITMTGGTFYGLPVITSQYAILGTPANNLVILLAAPEILMADDGSFQIDISREASLEMDDAPTMDAGSLGSPAGATGSVVVSMFQTNSAAVRCERFIYWARRRSGTTPGSSGVAWIDDVQWAAGTQ